MNLPGGQHSTENALSTVRIQSMLDGGGPKESQELAGLYRTRKHSSAILQTHLGF